MTQNFTGICSHCLVIYSTSLYFISLEFHVGGQRNTSEIGCWMSMAEQHYIPHFLDVWAHSDRSNCSSGTANSCCLDKKREHCLPTASVCFEPRLHFCVWFVDSNALLCFSTTACLLLTELLLVRGHSVKSCAMLMFHDSSSQGCGVRVEEFEFGYFGLQESKPKSKNY